MSSNIERKFFALNVRRYGPQPSIFVRSFSAITRNATPVYHTTHLPGLHPTHLRLLSRFLGHPFPRDAQRDTGARKRWPAMRLENALLSLIRDSQARLIEPQRIQRAKKGRKKKRMKAGLKKPRWSRHAQAMRRPSAVAKASGIPKSLIETSGAADLRALRARRCSQERR
jgi:hypothetical protein